MKTICWQKWKNKYAMCVGWITILQDSFSFYELKKKEYQPFFSCDLFWNFDVLEEMLKENPLKFFEESLSFSLRIQLFVLTAVKIPNSHACAGASWENCLTHSIFLLKIVTWRQIIERRQNMKSKEEVIIFWKKFWHKIMVAWFF